MKCTQLTHSTLESSKTFQAELFVVGKRKHWEEKVASMFQEGVKPGEQTRMPMTAFPVPSLPPSMLSCSCMRMSYILRVFSLVCAKNNVYNHGEYYCTVSLQLL